MWVLAAATAVVLVGAALTSPTAPAVAATPASGSVGPALDSTSWSGTSNGPTGPAPFGSPVDDGEPCRQPGQCDEFLLTVRSLPEAALLDVVVSTAVVAEDFDLQVFLGSTEVAQSAEVGTPPERVTIPVSADAGDITYRVVVNPWAAPKGTVYAGKATLSKPTDVDLNAVRSTAPPPGYTNYPAPGDLFRSYAEPTIGVNHKTNAAFFQQGLTTAKVTFDEATGPPTASWKDVTALETGVTTLDPIVEVDPQTGRIIVSQLLGICSASAVSDDDGQTWSPSSGCPEPHGVDHQTLGAGPRSPATPAAAGAYANAVYYCSQSVAFAFCGRSDDGGKTFGASVPIYNVSQCGGLHGHAQVAPDGTVYVPNGRCGGRAAVVVSEDGGRTWSIRPVPFSTSPAQPTHPSVGIGSDGTLYLGYRSGEANAMIAVSTDRGKTWTRPVNVASDFGIRNATFPVVVAGDGDRAAFAFLGTTTAGDPDPPSFETDGAATNRQYTGPGWHLYVAHTYDRGLTWVTSDVTPTNPVQRGCLYHGGGDDPCRDLLDFNGIAVDRQGRVLIAYTDGCLGKCEGSLVVSDNDRTDAKGTIARLTMGTGLLQAFDGQLAPGSAPIVCAIKDPKGDAAFDGIGPSQPTLDIVGATTGLTEDGSVQFTAQVADLGPPPPPYTGMLYRWNFVAEGIPYRLDATRQGTAAATLAMTRDGKAVANPGTAVFDEKADTVTITVRRDAFSPGVKESTVLNAVAIEARALTPAPVLALLFDTAGAPCAFTLAGYSAGAAPGTTGVASGSSNSDTSAGRGQVAARAGGRLPATGGRFPMGLAGAFLAAGLAAVWFRRRTGALVD